MQTIPVTQFQKESESDKANQGNLSTECPICLCEYEDDESDIVDLEVSVSMCESLGGNLTSEDIREDVDEERSVFY
ncbi:hypothetical protein L1987_22272 [Smallanthus sonchifolius]|uniref:Uncharacterized protein n=1 Tax=Smallanthus sonchifolius TaxID=185202 RepID=A0ACB9IFV8_9ASTR|nr:hypothetical protein L1987_22272 [Smallanthus sonchifolius]